MSNRLILWIIVLVAGTGLIISANIFRDTNQGPVSQGMPIISESPSPSPDSSSVPFSPKSNISVPATCQLSGEIVFINQNLYETIGAKIAYQNVDDAIRQIYWKSNPGDGVLTIGPNLFENLEIPNGEREIGVVLKGEPSATSYLLTAVITYGVKQPSGAMEVKIANCSGMITVKMP